LELGTPLGGVEEGWMEMEREEESKRREKRCKTELRCAPRHIFAIYMIFLFELAPRALIRN
jgi:hypothetical protein